MGILDDLTSANCGSCHYWAAKEGTGVGECLRHSPAIIYPAVAGSWPLTTPDVWCGDWERRHEAA